MSSVLKPIAFVLLCTASVLSHAAEATLSVQYEVRASGDYASSDKVLRREWHVDNRFEVVAKLKARPASAFPALHPAEKAQQAADASRTAAAGRAADAMAPMMADAMKIMQRCGDDEDCIARESMKMAQSVDVDSAALRGARQDIATASAQSAPRYQLFEPTTQTGTYSINETLKEADRDPLCMHHPNASCHHQVVVKGQGESSHEGRREAPSTAMLEIDTERNTVRLMLPIPYPAKVNLVSTTDKPGYPNEQREVYRSVTQLAAKNDAPHPCGAGCRSAAGSDRFEIEDELSGQPAQLIVNWRLDIR